MPRMSERHHVLSVTAAQENFKRYDISDIDFVMSSKNMAKGVINIISKNALQTVSVGKPSVTLE